MFREMPDAPFLVCFDGSDCAAAAIREAGEIVGGGPALIAHAWLPPSALMLARRMPEPSHPLAEAVQEFDAAARAAAEQLTAEGAGIAAEAGFAARPVTIEAPDGVWRPLLELAEEHEASAVIVGSHGRSPVSAAVLGSVSRGIVNHSKRPVIVVPR